MVRCKKPPGLRGGTTEMLVMSAMSTYAFISTIRRYQKLFRGNPQPLQADNQCHDQLKTLSETFSGCCLCCIQLQSKKPKPMGLDHADCNCWFNYCITEASVPSFQFFWRSLTWFIIYYLRINVSHRRRWKNKHLFHDK